MYKLTKLKKIDGYKDCTHFTVQSILNNTLVVGSYGILNADKEFESVYGSATCLKSALVDYVEGVGIV